MEELERVVSDNVIRRVLQMSAVRQTHVRGPEGENGAQFVAFSGKRLDVVVLDVVVRRRVAEGSGSGEEVMMMIAGRAGLVGRMKLRVVAGRMKLRVVAGRMKLRVVVGRME